MSSTPDYFPKASEQQLKDGWNYSFEFMDDIKKYVEDQGEEVQLEAIDAILKYVESGFIASAPSLLAERDSLRKENEELIRLLREALPKVEHCYDQSVKAAAHQEFLSEDRELMSAIRAVLSRNVSKPSAE